MKKILLAISVLVGLSACSDSSSTQSGSHTTVQAATTEAEPQSSEMDELKLAYIKLDNGTVRCDYKMIDGKYAFAACQFISIGNKSTPQIWYYDNQKDVQKRFYAFTGKARTTYENHLSGNPILGDYAETFGLPIPKEMDLEKITQAFQ